MVFSWKIRIRKEIGPNSFTIRGGTLLVTEEVMDVLGIENDAEDMMVLRLVGTGGAKGVLVLLTLVAISVTALVRVDVTLT